MVATVALLDQRMAAAAMAGSGGVKKELAGALKATVPSLACRPFTTLEELRSAERGCLVQGRALLRCDVKIAEVEAV